ncbi:hypothetical protein LOC67_14080 [Stieleria sp. JC731]|uniref:hypothetical protein n=1 Tax=Stieleria sp. JC731 TaxID=2894195 RepID=UPI001E6562FB|nr:hypothetical protein [Stieleria sp. JC731]MCC9601683.1 hypothetical protein [Stieleria sp. JC731]
MPSTHDLGNDGGASLRGVCGSMQPVIANLVKVAACRLPVVAFHSVIAAFFYAGYAEQKAIL